MALFGSARDASLVRSINRELINDFIDTEIAFYKLSLDDIYYLVNKDKAATNVANNTKQDMLKQMKNVRNIPASASDSNNQGNSQKSPDDTLFEGMLGLDDDVDNLFG